MEKTHDIELEYSNGHICFVRDHDGRIYEVLKCVDYGIAPIEAPFMPDGNRYARFFEHGQHNADMVRDNLRGYGYVILSLKMKRRCMDQD